MSITQCSEWRPQIFNELFAPFHMVILREPTLLLSEITMDDLSWTSCANKKSKLDVKCLENLYFLSLAVCDIIVLRCLENKEVISFNSLWGHYEDWFYSSRNDSLALQTRKGFHVSCSLRKVTREKKLARTDPYTFLLCVSLLYVCVLWLKEFIKTKYRAQERLNIYRQRVS